MNRLTDAFRQIKLFLKNIWLLLSFDPFIKPAFSFLCGIFSLIICNAAKSGFSRLLIQNYGTMLQQPDLSDEDRTNYARTVTNASQRLASLITNILKLNKLENQQIYPAKERFDLGERLCECLLGFENAWEAKNLELETDIADGVMVESDPELLSLVWSNLFSNAIKFTEDGGTVGLKLFTENDQAVVAVTDTGCGISPEVGAHIFEKFYQGDTSHATQGNGLGLALVRRVVDIVGGEIGVSSEPGKGSTFTVKIRREI